MGNDAPDPDKLDPKATGVYMIRCAVNGKVYVGSAARSIRGRWNNHKCELSGGVHYNRYLQRAWNKYGETAFQFIVLEECPPQDCVAREQFWIDQKRAADQRLGYNLSPTAGSLLGYKISDQGRANISAALKGLPKSPETRAKLSAALKGKPLTEERRQAISRGSRGKPKTQEHNKKVSLAKTGKKRPPFSKEWLEAMSKAKKGKSKTEEHKRKILEGRLRYLAARRVQLPKTQLPLPFLAEVREESPS